MHEPLDIVHDATFAKHEQDGRRVVQELAARRVAAGRACRRRTGTVVSQRDGVVAEARSQQGRSDAYVLKASPTARSQQTCLHRPLHVKDRLVQSDASASPLRAGGLFCV